VSGGKMSRADLHHGKRRRTADSAVVGDRMCGVTLATDGIGYGFATFAAASGRCSFAGGSTPYGGGKEGEGGGGGKGARVGERSSDEMLGSRATRGFTQHQRTCSVVYRKRAMVATADRRRR
jgi:hypothetical protein